MRIAFKTGFKLPWFEPPKTYGEGRRCESCGCILSVYNPNDKCLPYFFVQKQNAREFISNLLRGSDEENWQIR